MTFHLSYVHILFLFRFVLLSGHLLGITAHLVDLGSFCILTNCNCVGACKYMDDFPYYCGKP